jgi:hypothetical protein
LAVTPCGGSANTTPSAPNAWYVQSHNWRQFFTEEITITSEKPLKRVNDEYVLIPCIIASDVLRRMYGTMRGVFCINPDTDVNPEDRIWINGEAYRAFQNCNKSNRNYFFVLKEY